MILLSLTLPLLLVSHAGVVAPVVLAAGSSRAAESTRQPVVVLGASGKTGRLVVQKLASSGNLVRPVFRGEPGELFKGISNVESSSTADVTRIETLESALSGASAVVFAASASSKGGKASQVDFIGVENVAKECIRLQIPRLVVISSGAITRPDSLGFRFTNIFGSIMEYKLKGENALKSAYANSGSDLSYVIIRPGGLSDAPAAGPSNIELNQGDTISGEVSREDVADCAASAALSSTIPKRVTLEMYEKGRSGPLEGKFPSTSGYERNAQTFDEAFKGLTPGDVFI